MTPLDFQALSQRDPLSITPLTNVVLAQRFGKLAAEVGIVSGHGIALAAANEVRSHMVGRQDAIAVEKQQVRRRAGGGPFVAAAGELKAVVRMRGEADGKAD